MITLRRAMERHHDRRRDQDTWLTFHLGVGSAACPSGFGALAVLAEDRFRPGGGVPRQGLRDVEIVTYVREGALEHDDSTGCSDVILAGEFQCLTTGSGMFFSVTNESRRDSAQRFQVWLWPSERGLSPLREKRRFSAAERRGLFCVVASPDARRGSLRIHQDALVCSAMLYPGQHVVHELAPGRGAWVHVVHGEATLADLVLTTGDGAGVTAERAVSLTARDETELLLIDVGELRPGPSDVSWA